MLTAESEKELQRIVDRVKEVGKDFGMKSNVSKTKTIAFSMKDVRLHAKIYIDRQLLEQVSQFTYLGQLITEVCKYEEETKLRIGQARSVFNSMKKVLCCRKLPSRIGLLKCCYKCKATHIYLTIFPTFSFFYHTLSVIFKLLSVNIIHGSSTILHQPHFHINTLFSCNRISR